MRAVLLSILITLYITVYKAQTPILDSLKTELQKAKHDTTRCSILSKMVELEEDDKIWSKYNDEARIIAENNLNSIEKKSPLRLFYIKSLAGALNNIGYLAKFQGDIPKALEYYHQSIKLYEQIDDKENIANALNNIGFVHKDQGEFQKALDAFVKNLKLYKDSKNESGESITLNNMGIVYSDQHKFTEALDCYQKCLKLQEKLKNKKITAYALNNIGFVYYKKANLDIMAKEQRVQLLATSLDYFQKSLKVREEIQDKRGIAISLQNIAEAMMDVGMIKEAQTYAEKSLWVSRELGYPDNIKRSSNVLSKIYAKTNNWKAAFDMQVLFKQMSDSLSNESTRKLSIQKGFQIEYEKKAAADSVKVFEEKKVINAQLKQEKTQRFALYGGLVLVALFGAFMYNRFKVTQKQNHIIHIQKSELQHQKEIVDEKQKEMLDSIHYAKRIQNALIANTEFINKHLENNFIYFNPKDIVSGDFYWATHYNNQFYLAVCDSTGHGVPGAFMSLLNIGFLSEAIKEKNITKPHEVLNYVRQRLIHTMSNEGQKDGMDGILICYDKENNTLEYAAANNAPILIRGNEIIELAKDKMPIGQGEKIDSFTLHTVSLQKGDALYLYTDGFADQFGGPESGKGGKKFKYKPLNNLLLQNTHLPLSEQSHILQSTFQNWKGNLEQVDDVCVIGIKI